MGKKSRSKKQKHQSTASQPTKLSLLCARLIEAGWLLLVMVLPVYINTATKQVFELDKIMLFRSMVEIMLAFYLVKLWEAARGEKYKAKGVKTDSNFFTKTVQFWVRQKINPWLGSALVLFFLATTLATIFSQVPQTSFWGSYFRSQGLFTLLHYFVFCFLLMLELRSFAQIKRLVVALLAGSIPVLIYAFIQRAGLDPLPWGEMAFGSRVFSTFGQPNFLGGYMAMLLPFTLAVLLRSSRLWLKLSMVTLLALQLLATFYTASRGAMIGCIVSILLYFFFTAYQKRSKWLWVGGGLFVAIVALAGLLLVVDNPLQSTLKKATRLDNATYMTRLYYWEGALKGIADRPIFGHGPESMYATFSRYYDARSANTEGTNIIPDRTHNETLDVAYTTGLLGLASYLVLLATIIVIGLRSLRRNQEYTFLIAAFLTSFIGYLARAQFSFGTSVLYLFFYLIVASLNFFDRRVSVPSKPKHKTISLSWRDNNLWRYLGLAGALVVAIFWFNYLPMRADMYFKQGDSLFNKGDYENATAQYLKATQTYPKQSVYYLYLTNSYYSQAYYAETSEQKNTLLDQAHAALENWRKRERADANYFETLGMLHSYEAQVKQDTALFDQAESAYSEAAAQNPEKAALFDEWGMMLMQASRFSEARDKFQRANELFTNKDWIQYHQYKTHLAGAYYYLGEYDEALALMHGIFHPGKFTFDTYEARALLASIYVQKGNVDAAIGQAAKAVKLQKNDVTMHLVLMRLYLEKNNLQQAKEVAQAILKLDPENSDALSVLANR